MKVYRIAHPDHPCKSGFPQGPYTYLDYVKTPFTEADTDLQVELGETQNSVTRHPAPVEDPDLGGINSWEVCGFATVADVWNWFHTPEMRAALKAAGLRLYTYDLDDMDVRVGRCGQCVFPKAAARLVEVVEIETEETE